MPHVRALDRHGPRVEVHGTGPVLALVASALVAHGITPSDLRVEQPAAGSGVRPREPITIVGMRDRFPAIEPHDAGMLDVGDGHCVYWECCGNPHGKPAIYLHGGPGSGCTPGQRRWFDPDTYRVVLFDQRGSGRSRPLASEPDADLPPRISSPTSRRCAGTSGIESWTVLGMSWGTTLGLAYAQAHVERVSALVLALVTTTCRREVEWLTRDVGRIFPQEWDRFAAAVPRHAAAPAARRRLRHTAVRPRPRCPRACGAGVGRWEDAHVSLTPSHVPGPRYEDPEFRLRFERLVTHYWRNAAFSEEDQLLRDAPAPNRIPGVLVHGGYDVSSPLEQVCR